MSSTQLVTDENGDQVARFIYGAWGEELYASESVPGILENRFVGGLGCRKDAATGLVYMRHRWYDPALQRFISRDPIGLKGGANLYKYAGNNPMNSVDPWGLNPNPDSSITDEQWAHIIQANAAVERLDPGLGEIPLDEIYSTSDNIAKRDRGPGALTNPITGNVHLPVDYIWKKYEPEERTIVLISILANERYHNKGGWSESESSKCEIRVLEALKREREDALYHSLRINNLQYDDVENYPPGLMEYQHVNNVVDNLLEQAKWDAKHR